MAKIQVFKFKVWNQIAGESITSKFMAPLTTIKDINGASPIEGTAIEIDDSELNGNYMYESKTVK